MQLSFDNGSDTFVSIIALLSSVFLLTFPVFVSCFLLFNFRALKQPAFYAKFGSLYQGLRADSKASLMFMFVYVIRRFTFCLIAFYLLDYPFAQIQFLILSCMGVIIYIGGVKPYQSAFMNRLEMFNETCILFVSYLLCCFTDYVQSSEWQYSIGWLVVMFTTTNLITNSIIIISMGVRKLCDLVKRKCKKAPRSRSYPVKNLEEYSDDLKIEELGPDQFQKRSQDDISPDHGSSINLVGFSNLYRQRKTMQVGSHNSRPYQNQFEMRSTNEHLFNRTRVLNDSGEHFEEAHGGEQDVSFGNEIVQDTHGERWQQNKFKKALTGVAYKRPLRNA